MGYYYGENDWKARKAKIAKNCLTWSMNHVQGTPTFQKNRWGGYDHIICEN